MRWKSSKSSICASLNGNREVNTVTRCGLPSKWKNKPALSSLCLLLRAGACPWLSAQGREQCPAEHCWSKPASTTCIPSWVVISVQESHQPGAARTFQADSRQTLSTLTQTSRSRVRGHPYQDSSRTRLGGLAPCEQDGINKESWDGEKGPRQYSQRGA